MNKYEEKQIKAMQRHLLTELERVGKMNKSSEEGIARLNTLWNINQYLDHYEELEPVLKQYFAERKKKDDNERIY